MTLNVADWANMSVKEYRVRTSGRIQFVNITSSVEEAVTESGVEDGLAVVYVPHTTAGVTINENADPSVPRDIQAHLAAMIPRSSAFTHAEGNSDSHIMASLVGSSQTVIIRGGRLLLGTWQGIFFCEFDGPRSRRYVVSCT